MFVFIIQVLLCIHIDISTDKYSASRTFKVIYEILTYKNADLLCDMCNNLMHALVLGFS
ncbi:hypothetical protein ACP275_13G053800 [Erythranthe tilingii]